MKKTQKKQNDSLNIVMESCKYLKSLKFISSFSPHTLKAYATDLSQAFELKALGRFLLEGQNVDFLPSTTSDLPHWDSQEILKQARQAQSQWGNLSLASRNRKAATLKSFFKWLYNEKKLQEDISLKITCPKVPKKIPHFLSLDEALHLIKHLQKKTEESHRSEKTLLLTLLLYGGGLRVSEACQVQWKDIDLHHRQLKVLGKGQKERICLLPTLAFKQLKKWQRHQHPQQPTNTSIWGDKALSPRSAWQLIHDAGSSAGLTQPLSPHALRHSFATHILSSGANLRTLQKLLGHESLQATEKYTHLGVDELAQTLEKFHPIHHK